MTFRFESESVLRWSDVDRAGVLNNAVYLTLLEEARFAYFGELGLLEGDDFPFLLGETCVRFLRPGRAGMRVVIRARTLRIGTKSLEMAYEIEHGGEPLASAVATLVWVGRAGTSCAVPAAARAAIATFEDLSDEPAGAPGRSLPASP